MTENKAFLRDWEAEGKQNWSKNQKRRREAIAKVKETANSKFDETIELHLRTSADPRHADQQLRGTATLPAGLGKAVRVAVFAQGDKAELARAAGADVVGFDDLAEQVQGGEINFDVVIASPDAMRVVGKLGTILGPRGLMPNPKTGTVTPDVETAVQNAKAGQVRYRTDKNGIIHGAIGSIKFEANALQENLEALLADLKKAKPASAKGVYLKKITLSSTMGPGLVIDQSSLAVAK